MINNPRVLVWFVVHFTVAVYGAVSALTDAATGLLAAVAAAAAAAFTALLGWSARRREDANKSLSEILAGAGLAAFLYLLFTRDMLFALGALLFFAQLAVNVTLREYRQLYLGLVVAFILVMVGASESFSGYYLLVLIFYTLSGSYCLAESWLDKEGGTVADLPSPSGWQRLRVAGNIVLLALVVYLVMPRPPAALLGAREANSPELYQNRHWEQQAESPPGQQSNTFEDLEQQSPSRPDAGDRGDTPQHPQNRREGDEPAYDYSGFERQFDIGQAGERNPQQGNAVVAYMQAPHGSYLKVRVFDRFDGERWSGSRDDYITKKLERGRIALEPALEPNFQQTIHIRQTLPAWIPAAPRIVSLHLPSTVLALDAWDRPLLPGSLKAQTRYTVDSYVSFEQGRPVGAGPAPQAGDLQVPGGQDPRIARLAAQVTAQSESNLEKAEALERHLRTQYQYSYQSIFDSQGVTPLSRFLFEEKAGHCEYFASAMAVMLRTLGIPARLVTGFSATRKNPLTGYYEIRALDGHAWVEAWIGEYGWLVFEPTAMYALPQPSEEKLSARQINEYAENLQRLDEALGENDLSVRQLLIAAWRTLYHAAVIALSYLKLALVVSLPYIVTAVILAGIAWFSRRWWLPPLMIHWYRRRIRHYRPGQPEKALHFYLYYLQRIAAYHQTGRRPSQTIEQWADHLAHRYQRRSPFAELAAAVNAAFYQGEEVDLHNLRPLVQRTADTIRRS